MTIETVVMTDRVAVPFLTKLNPLWWLVGPDGWTVPEVNNGASYLPDVTNPALRIFYWFFCRNPLMNFVGYVLGCEDNNYRATGSAPVMATTLRDAVPPRRGWKWAVLLPQFSVAAVGVFLAFVAGAVLLHWSIAILAAFALAKFAAMPYVAYNGAVEFYLGWRPYSGGFGFKFVIPSDPTPAA